MSTSMPNSLCLRSRPRAPIERVRSGSRSSSAIACASAGGSWGATCWASRCRQDHYAVALGGFTYTEFVQAGGVRVEPIVAPLGTLEAVLRSLLLFYTGRQRAASTVLEGQRAALIEGTATQSLQEMRDLARE
jgi:hypothetical protein